MSRAGSPSKRAERDVMRLMMSDYHVELVNESICEVLVEFAGPKDSPYEGGVWKVRVELPDSYPYKSPSIGFVNRIFHPNVDLGSGSVCLDVINQTWSPMFDLFNVFDVFLPQLLLYPNPTDPLNGEAAALLMREPAAYRARVKEYVERFATKGTSLSRTTSSAAKSSKSSKSGAAAARRSSDGAGGAAAADSTADGAGASEEGSPRARGSDGAPLQRRGSQAGEGIDSDEEDEDCSSEGGFLSSSEEEEEDGDE